MRTIYARLHPDRLNVPLVTFATGRYSSAVLTVGGDIPCDIAALAVEIGRTPDSDTHASRPNLVADAVRGECGEWSAYLSPFFFPDVSDALRYHVVGNDTAGSRRWLGSGALRVLASPCADEPVPPPTGAHGVFLESEVVGGVQHYKRQEIRYDEEMGAWGADWTGDYIYTPGGFVPVEKGEV